MKVLVKKLIAGLMLGIAMLAGAPQAQADEGSYISNLENSGWGYGGQKGQYLDLGYRVCRDWNAGFTRGRIWDEVWNNPGVHFANYGAAQRLVNEAIAELC